LGWFLHAAVRRRGHNHMRSNTYGWRGRTRGQGIQIFHIFLPSLPHETDRPNQFMSIPLPTSHFFPPPPSSIVFIPTSLSWAPAGLSSVKTSERGPASKGQHKLQVTANSCRPFPSCPPRRIPHSHLQRKLKPPPRK
jgi:hypothetical protein